MKATQAVLASKSRTLRKSPMGLSQKSGLVESLMRLMALETGKAIQFEVAAKGDSRVCIAGTFNDWDPTTHPLTYHPEDGLFKATLLIEAGTHEYKLVVNGIWHMDDTCPHRALNPYGTLNSVIRI